MPRALTTRLEPDELRLYHAPSTSVLEPETAERCLRMLDAEERARHERFRFERDRMSYLTAHALTRGVLARQLAVQPSELRFANGPHGRPELAWPDSQPRLRFNLSHTHGRVACAIALERDVGVDIEHLDRRVDIAQLAPSVFSEAERAELATLDAEAARLRFFELWTLKEAYIKAVGKGLSLPLRSITLVFGQAGPRLQLAVPLEGEPSGFWFHLERLPSPHLLAVTRDGPEPLLEVGELSPTCES